LLIDRGVDDHDPELRVVVLVGLVGLESQDCSRESHPVVGEVFGWWFTVLVVITWRTYLVYDVAQGWRLLQDGYPLGPSEWCRRAYPCQSERSWWSSTPLHSS
jgi:hypothetical protein